MGQHLKFNIENDDHSETHPCFEPIVWTNGTNKDNQPDLADLQEKCKQGQTIQHKVKLLDQMFQGNTNIMVHMPSNSLKTLGTKSATSTAKGAPNPSFSNLSE